MPSPRFVVPALSAAAAAVVASVLLLRPTGAVIDDDAAGDGEAAVKFVEARGEVSVARANAVTGRRAGRAESSGSVQPVRERGDVGEPIDPDSFDQGPSSGGVSDVGGFQDPDYAVAQTDGVISHVGNHLLPEEAP